ncbi:hypothetical protein DFH07DRAFT_770446 [Mycena maculata]|uniref:Uncharacterized protein n=1 Tax=Mycena maculata TaxID=230809 RepID=A0AAD7NKU1_9AGAR|nr:hypothetical protein DFH07DRAFT_770446 [Mycena maculata]
MCFQKIALTDGVGTTECPCPRYIPQDDPKPGPQVCRDCEHWESLHPVANLPKATPIADLMARIRPQMEKARQLGVTDNDARKEANAGFKKVSEEGKGRRGATKYQKKTGGRSGKAAEKTHSAANVVMIPDAYFGDPDASDAADDIKEVGVTPVPLIPRLQQLKDGRLIVSWQEEMEHAFTYVESWSSEHIDKALKKLFPHVWLWMQETHQPLEDGMFYWIPLVAYHSRLNEFVKKGPITGSDLETIKSGKGKCADQMTLYFALCYNIPNKVWANDCWTEPPSDADFQDKLKKGKGKAPLKPLSTRSTCKAAVKEENNHSVIEVHSDEDNGSSTSSNDITNAKGKTSQQNTPVKIKLELELAAIAKTESLFLDIDSESDVDFPESLAATASPAAMIVPSVPPPASGPVVSSAAPSPIGTTSVAAVTPAAPITSVALTPVPSQSVIAAAGGSFGIPRSLGSSAPRPSTHFYGGSASTSSRTASLSIAGPSSSSASSSRPNPWERQKKF